MTNLFDGDTILETSSTRKLNLGQFFGKNLLQIKLRTRAIYDVAFPKINSILCHIDTALLGKKFYIGQVNTPPNGRHIIFATYQQLVILRDNTSWFVDATFRIVKLPFMQLLTVHVAIVSPVNVIFVPVLFVLMSRRRAIDYKAIFTYAINYIHNNLGGNVLISSVKLDFEIAMWQGFRALSLVANVPPFTIKGCYFHFCQALFRKLVNVGLKGQYLKDSGTKTICRMLMFLCFLPTSDIPKTFAK